MARILVADDEEGIRSFLCEALELADHDVTGAADGAAALKALRQRSHDVLVTDLRMPELDGMELLKLAREEQPELEVIVLTAQGSVAKAVEAMRLGAYDFLEKPLESPTELRLLVERAVERRRLRTLEEGARRESTDAPELGYGAPAMTAAVDALRKVARTDATVLLLGESGTGKELAARAVHAWSRRSAGPLVAVNCAALSPTLLESELFGHERGAFTGAHAQRRGRLELAEGGTLFLDEVGELAIDLQAKLLRVLEERQFERVGGTRTLDADVRWVAATHRDLPAMVKDGTFREDLYHRLAVFPVELPPLRERREDIAPIADALLERIAGELGQGRLALSDEARARLRGAPWPGNVRELRNALERAAILSEGGRIEATDLSLGPVGASHAADAPRTLAEIERRAIERALEEVGGNRREAAERLGIGLRTLYEKLKRYASE